jgi:hypothetical protein
MYTTKTDRYTLFYSANSIWGYKFSSIKLNSTHEGMEIDDHYGAHDKIRKILFLRSIK